MIIIHDFLYTLTFSLYLFSPEKKSGRFLHELFPLKHNQKNLKFEEKKTLTNSIKLDDYIRTGFEAATSLPV